MNEPTTIPAGDHPARGWLSRPTSEIAPGILLLPAWWGANPFFLGLGERLADEGFVTLTVDLTDGVVTDTVDDAQQAMQQRDPERVGAVVRGAIDVLTAAEGVRTPIGVVGFSMGGAWGLVLAAERPDAVAAVTVFYASQPVDFAAARATYLGHFGEADDWEPVSDIRRMESDIRAAGRPFHFHYYPGACHWFFEEDRPEHDADAAALAWSRTTAFLHGTLDQA